MDSLSKKVNYLNKMTKRSREQSVEFVVRDDHTEVRYNDKIYFWNHPADVHFESLMKLQKSEFDFYISHNPDHKAILVIEDLKEDEIRFQFKINPIKYGDVAEWLVDE
jgi:hypothetical protein